MGVGACDKEFQHLACPLLNWLSPNWLKSPNAPSLFLVPRSGALLSIFCAPPHRWLQWFLILSQEQGSQTSGPCLAAQDFFFCTWKPRLLVVPENDQPWVPILPWQKWARPVQWFLPLAVQEYACLPQTSPLHIAFLSLIFFFPFTQFARLFMNMALALASSVYTEEYHLLCELIGASLSKCSFYRWRNWGQERWRDLSGATQWTESQWLS